MHCCRKSFKNVNKGLLKDIREEVNFFVVLTFLSLGDFVSMARNPGHIIYSTSTQIDIYFKVRLEL